MVGKPHFTCSIHCASSITHLHQHNTWYIVSYINSCKPIKKWQFVYFCILHRDNYSVLFISTPFSELTCPPPVYSLLQRRSILWFHWQQVAVQIHNTSVAGLDLQAQQISGQEICQAQPVQKPCFNLHFMCLKYAELFFKKLIKHSIL